MSELSAYVVNGKNVFSIKCSNCNSSILGTQEAEYITDAKSIPTVGQKQGSTNYEEISEWWMVKDMFTFDNIGFTHSVGSQKYLSCADCEMGPLGIHNLNTKESFVAIPRIKQV